MQDQDAAGSVLDNDDGAELVVATIDGTQLDGETQVTGALGTLTIAPDGSSGAGTEDDPDNLQAAGVLNVTGFDNGEDRFADPAPAALQSGFGAFAFAPLSGA